MKTIRFEYRNENGERKNYEVQPLKLEYNIVSNNEEEWILKAIDQKSNECSFLLRNIHRIFDDNIQRFFCVTVYVMNKEKKFLMLLNKKLNRWVPPGGKIDGHEIPEDAAIRECYEETGIHIELIGEKAPVEGGLLNPKGIQLNQIIPNLRDHIDLIYFARPIEDEPLKISEREASNIGWFSYEEMVQLDTFPSVLQWSKKYLNSCE